VCGKGGVGDGKGALILSDLVYQRYLKAGITHFNWELHILTRNYTF